MASKACVVFVTVDKAAAVKKITKAVLTSRLAACVSEVKNMKSSYHWKGKIEKNTEALLIMKTRTELVARLIALVKKNHPYEVPEIIAIEIKNGSSGYLQWIAEETKGHK